MFCSKHVHFFVVSIFRGMWGCSSSFRECLR